MNMFPLTLTAITTSMFVVSAATADYEIIEIEASSSASLNATGCCTMSYMGSTNPSSISMKNCQSVYMSCVQSKRAAVWLFDLSDLPEDATLVSARFKGERTYSDMSGMSGFISLEFNPGSLNSSVCMSLWNGGDWQSWMTWPYGGTAFSLTVTSGISSQFASASSVALMGYASSTYGVTVINSGAQQPVLEVTIDVPDAPTCEGDINGDGVVDGTDVSLILGYWGSANSMYDLDGNSIVDGGDLAMVLGGWGPCPE